MKLTDMDVKTIQQKTYRLIPSAFPPIDLFERVSSQAEFEMVCEIESLTNDRIRNEIGELSLVAREDRLFGDGASLIMAPFTHFKTGYGGRFNANYGVFYCAREFDTALAETKYHRAKFFKESQTGPTKISMRELVTDLNADLHSIADQQTTLPEIYDPDDYRQSQALGAELKTANVWGLEYNSVRCEGMCYAIFRPPALSNCRQNRHFEYYFDGEEINMVVEMKLMN